MAITTLSSQAFCLAIGTARSATRDGPVIIIDDDGRPAHVLLSFEEYRRMGGMLEDPHDRLGRPDIDDRSAEVTESDEAATRTEIDASPWAFMLEALEAFELEVDLSSEGRRRTLLPDDDSA